jgi:hypothetical protein
MASTAYYIGQMWASLPLIAIVLFSIMTSFTLFGRKSYGLYDGYL